MSDAITPSTHPAVSGREREYADLVDEIRRLITISVTHVTDGAETAEVAAELRRLNDRLEARVPDPVLPRFYMPTEADATLPEPREESTPFDPVTGRFNPLALPLKMHLEPGLAVGEVTITTPYEGPPGCVHGAVLAGLFDMVLTAGNQLEDAAGPTIDLMLRYKKPTRLHVPTRFEGWIESREGRVTKAAGRALQGDVVTVEATGTFLKLSHDQVLKLATRASGDPL